MTQPYLGKIAFWVSSANFERMRDFYSEIIGVPESAVGNVPCKWTFYVSEGFSFPINEGNFEPEDRGWSRCPMPPSLGDNWLPYATCYLPDPDAVIERCRAKGIAMRTDEPFSLGEGFGFSIDLRDPDGNTVAATERGE